MGRCFLLFSIPIGLFHYSKNKPLIHPHGNQYLYTDASGYSAAVLLILAVIQAGYLSI